MPAHSDMGPIEQLIHCTARIEAYRDGKLISFGSSYLFRFALLQGICSCLITNKHVIKDANRIDFVVTLTDSSKGPVLGSQRRISLPQLGSLLVAHPNPAVDLVAIIVGPSLQEIEAETGYPPYLVALAEEMLPNHNFLDSLSPVEEILMIGYPNGLWDEVHNLPIVRRGITATNLGVRHNGKPEFLIDAACFPGSSGSPVFIANLAGYTDKKGTAHFGSSRLALIGTLYAGPQHNVDGEIVVINIPTDTKSISKATIPNNLGYVIQASELRTLKAAILERTKKPSAIGRNQPCTCGSGKRYKECHGKFA